MAIDYQNYLQNSTDAINTMYNERSNAALGELEAAYNQNLSNATAARDKLPAQYNAQANDLAVQYERNRRNLNEQAAANGINTGAGSQQRLALNSTWNRDYGKLRTAQAGAIAEADRDITNLTNTYNSKRVSARAEIEAQRQAALLQAQEQQYNRDLQQAQLKAGYGDFSGFTNLGYDQNTINNMRQVWIAQNPLLAYNTGAITAAQYYKMTGKYAPGYEPQDSGGGYGGSSGGSSDKSDDSNPLNPLAAGIVGGSTKVWNAPYDRLTAELEKRFGPVKSLPK